MDMSGGYRIGAPREMVWAALNDAEVLQACIPGCERLTRISDHEFDVVVVQKIGPVKARFEGKVELADIDAPAHYRIQGEGKGGIAGFAKGAAEVTLTEADGQTMLAYSAHATVGGKLAQLGSRLIDSTARKLANQFFENFHVQLSLEVMEDGS